MKNNVGDAEKQKAGQASGLKIAGSGPGGRQEDGVGIVMSMDKDEATRRQERDAEAAAKRQQNALPAWHLKSTITGDLTALGIKESARAIGREGDGVVQSSDESLKGLGTIGTSQRPPQLTMVMEDVKLEVSQEMDCTLSAMEFARCHVRELTTNRLRSILCLIGSFQCSIFSKYALWPRERRLRRGGAKALSAVPRFPQ